MKEKEHRETNGSFGFLIQQLYGQDSYYEFKNYQDVPLVKKYYLKLLTSYSLAIADTIEIIDKAQIKKLQNIIDNGRNGLKRSKTFSEIDQNLISIQTKLILQLLGQVPNNWESSDYSNRRGNWKLNKHRQIQYVQNSEHKLNHILEHIYIKYPDRFKSWLKFKIDICSIQCHNDPDIILEYLRMNYPDIYEEVK